MDNLLKLYPSLTLNDEKNKVVCSLTGHEMPCREDAVASYTKGKKFQKARARDSSNYDKYKPHLVPSTKKYHENHLFCTLTLRHINKTPDHVERHVNGARYRRALARWQECEKTGVKFVPYVRYREEAASDSKKDMLDDESGADNSEQEDEASDADSFDDLYPAEDFKDSEKFEDKDSDYDFDGAEFTPDKQHTEPTVSSTEKQGTKRKGEMKKQKRLKKKKQKVG